MSVKLLGVVLLVASFIYYVRHYALLKSSGSVVALELSETMRCLLKTRNGQYIPCVILGSTFVAPYLTVLNLRPEKKFFDYSVVIFPDSIDGEKFRQLRVLLRWKWKSSNDRI